VAADGYLDASSESSYPGNTQYTAHRETRDPLSQTRWDTFSSTTAGCNREMYWDDATAIGQKYNLVINDKLRGAGIFALNYGGGAPELWDLINLKFGQCSEAAIAVDQTTPQIPGAKVTFRGSALCAGTSTFRFWMQLPTTSATFTATVTCQGTPEYRFLVLPPGGTWTVVQDYGAGNTFKWPPAGTPYGDYYVGVHARTTGTAVHYESYSSVPFSLTSCISAALTSDKASPQPTGTQVGLSPGATCDG